MSNIVDKAFDIIEAVMGETPVHPFKLRVRGDRGVVSVPAGTDIHPSINVDSIHIGVRGKWTEIYFSV